MNSGHRYCYGLIDTGTYADMQKNDLKVLLSIDRNVAVAC